LADAIAKFTMSIGGLDKAKRQMSELKAEAKKTKPLFDKAIIILEQSQMKTFRMEGRPRWKKSKRASEQGGQTLQDIGRLRQSVTASSSPSAIREFSGQTLKFGTKLIYAASHQYGYPPKNIPKRPFLGVYAEDIKKLEQVFEQDLTSRFRMVVTRG